MIEFTVPLPPSANALWKYGKGRVFKSHEYNAWKREAWVLTRMQGPRINSRVDGPYELTIVASRPDNKVRDLDNLLKSISDFCQFCGAIENDSNCQIISARWIKTGVGVYVRIDGIAEE